MCFIFNIWCLIFNSWSLIFNILSSTYRIFGICDCTRSSGAQTEWSPDVSRSSDYYLILIFAHPDLFASFHICTPNFFCTVESVDIAQGRSSNIVQQRSSDYYLIPIFAHPTLFAHFHFKQLHICTTQIVLLPPKLVSGHPTLLHHCSFCKTQDLLFVKRDKTPLRERISYDCTELSSCLICCIPLGSTIKSPFWKI